MRTLTRTLPLAAVLLAACGGESSSDGAFTVDTLANGRVVASNTGPGAWKPGKGWTLVEEARIGSADGDGPDVFSGIQAMEVDALGRVWLADQASNEIRVFGPDGRHVRTIGRKGGGPGEFDGIMGMSWARDGRLWVADPGNARYTVLDTAGALVTTHRRESGMMMTPWPGGFDAEGRLHDVILLPGGFARAGLVRFGTDMKPADTLAIPRVESPTFKLENEGSRMQSGVPFTGHGAWRLGRGGTWVARTDQYRLHRLGMRGDTVWTVERDFTPAPVTSAEKSEALEGLKWFTDQGGKVDVSLIPATKPAFQTFFEDAQGYLWVRPHLAEAAGEAYDVFEPTGRYLGRVPIPAKPGYLPPVVRGDQMYAMVVDDDDVQSVVRYRIQGRR